MALLAPIKATDSCNSATGCNHSRIACDDNDSCTEDLCDQASGCFYPPLCIFPQICCNGACCANAQACCDDGFFCNGQETCVNGACQSGDPPCTAALCDEDTDTCDDCTQSSQCDDGKFCSGIETCVSGSCVDGADPCPDQLCDDSLECVDCLGSGACDDGDPCTENDLCVIGFCIGTPLDCDDGDPCTEDSCADGVCSSAPPNCENNGDPCDPVTWSNNYPFCDDCAVTISVPETIVVNCDDDNDNGIPDFQEPGPVAGENDLVPVSLSLSGCPPMPDGFPRPGDVLTWHLDEVGGNTHYKVYLNPDKTNPVDHFGGHGLWPPPSTVYLEGILATAEDCPAPLILWPSFSYTAGVCIFCGYVGGQTTVVGNQVDLDVDSDNNNCSDPPNRSPAEDAVELTDSKYICHNDDDDDNNGVPDKNQEPPPVEDNDLVPMVAQIAPNAPVGSRWKLLYNSSKVQVYEDDRATIVPSNQTYNMALNPNPKNFWIEAIAATNAPGKIVLHVDSDGDGTFDCSDAVLVTTRLCDPIITAHVIDQDDPTSEAWTEVAENTPVYGGSEASTADNLKFTLAPPLPDTVSDITWTVEGTGSASFLPPPTGPDAVEWDVGDLLDPEPGPVVFAVSIRYDDGTKKCVEFKTEIGVRTDDVIVIGWINPDGVTLAPTTFVHPDILAAMPANGIVTSTFDCSIIVGQLSEGLVALAPGGELLTQEDRDYILQWLFHFGQDNFSLSFGPPPSDFRVNGSIDEQAIQSFVSQTTKYKVLARFQVKFRVDSAGARFLGSPVVLQASAIVGETRNPCGFNPQLPPFVDPIPGQTGPATTPIPIVSPQNQRISLIVDGSPDAPAVRAFDTLTAVVVLDPEVWENVGARITFAWDSTTSPQIVRAPFPSFYVYRNGVQMEVGPQVAVRGHFYGPGDVNYPVYPFGTVTCPTCPAGSCVLFLPIPDSRCGDATSTAAPTARIPEYTIP